MEENNNSDTQLRPGLRFHPSDQELIIYYLRNTTTSSSLPATIIAEVYLCKCDPWELPSKRILFGEEEWYFFTPRDRKYPNGVRPNRTTAPGYWQATDTDKHILSSCGAKILRVKKALVFYKGRPPKAAKTEWIMHEYRLPEPLISTSKQKRGTRLDDWVPCRVRQNSNIKMNGGAKYVFNNRPFESQKGDTLCSANSMPNPETIRDFVYRECMAPPDIFTSPDLPLDTDSGISYETSKTPPSVYEDSNTNCMQSSFPAFNILDSGQRRMQI